MQKLSYQDLLKAGAAPGTAQGGVSAPSGANTVPQPTTAPNANVAPSATPSATPTAQRMSLEQLQSAGATSGTAAGAPTQQPYMTSVEGSQGDGGSDWGKLGGLINAALPITGDIYSDVTGKNDKTALQQLGDLGLSALWFLPFGEMAKGAESAIKGVPELAKALGEGGVKTAANIGTGLATGYAGDVASNVAQGKTDASAFQPGLGTLAGGLIPTALHGAAGIYNKIYGQQQLVDRLQGVYEDAIGGSKGGLSRASNVAARGQNDAEFLAHSGIPLESQEVNGRTVLKTGKDSDAYNEISRREEAVTNLRNEYLDKSNARVTLEDARTKAEDAIKGSGYSQGKTKQMLQELNDAFDGLKKEYSTGEEVDPRANINTMEATRLKTEYDAASKSYKMNGDIARSDMSKIIADAMRSSVEDVAAKTDNVDVKALNKVISDHISAKKALLKMDGQIVKGGRLGKYYNRQIGAALGMVAAPALNAVVPGSGIVSQLLTQGLSTAAGVKGADLISSLSQRLAAGGGISSARLGQIATEEPAIIQELLQHLGKEAPEGGLSPRLKAESIPAAERVRSLVERYQPSNLVGGLIRRAKEAPPL